jgi:hypothetical protein
MDPILIQPTTIGGFGGDNSVSIFNLFGFLREQSHLIESLLQIALVPQYPVAEETGEKNDDF